MPKGPDSNAKGIEFQNTGDSKVTFNRNPKIDAHTQMHPFKTTRQKSASHKNPISVNRKRPAKGKGKKANKKG